jgi:cytidyltransferase-like protein
MNARELYLLSVKENGLSDTDAAKLSIAEQSMLEKRADGRHWLKQSERQRFNVVLTGRVFDVLHIGHVLTLQKAAELGNILIVIVTTNERVEKAKGRKPIHDADYRRAMVASLKPVDLALVGGTDMMQTFLRVQPDTVAFGYDQKPFALPGDCKSVHLTEIKADESMAKTSRIIRELGL